MIRSLAFFAFFSWFCVGLVSAQEPAVAPSKSAEFVGRWEGKLKPIGLDVVIEIRRQKEAWSGEVSIPVQKLEKRALVDFALEDEELRFSIADAPMKPTFYARLAGEGERLEGTMKQGPAKMTFVLDRRATAVERAEKALEGIDPWIEEVMGNFEVPGLSLAVVVDDRVMVARGYGFADLDEQKKVDAGTRFAIGSSTKAFTCFGLATLIAEGKLSWDDAVVDHLPGLRLHDESAGRLLTPRDMVTHRSGLPRHDLLWYAKKELSLEELMGALPHLEPTATIREAWQYNNLMYVLAGKLAARLDGGGAWEDHLRRRVFGPAGMNESLFAFEEARKGPGLASPYGDRDGEQREIPYRSIRHVGPAGSILSNARDMARWLRLMLNEGEIDGKQVLDAALCRELMKPQVTRPSGPVGEDGIDAYAHGWMVDYFRGHPRVHHGGNIDGFSALVTLYPGEDFGLVVLVNQDKSGVPSLVSRHLADRLLELERRDRVTSARQARQMARQQAKKAKQDRELDRKKGTTPAHGLKDYVGSYEHPGYGKLSVAMDGEGLAVTYGQIPAPLEHWHYETFSALADERDPTLEGMKFLFVTDVSGEVVAVEAKFEASVAALRFVRSANASMRDPAVLDRFVGRYALPGAVVRVARVGGQLRLTVPGQPTYELEPTRPGRFRLKALEGYSVVFEEDEGEVSGLRFVQPNGVFRAKRKR